MYIYTDVKNDNQFEATKIYLTRLDDAIKEKDPTILGQNCAAITTVAVTGPFTSSTTSATTAATQQHDVPETLAIDQGGPSILTTSEQNDDGGYENINGDNEIAGQDPNAPAEGGNILRARRSGGHHDPEILAKIRENTSSMSSAPSTPEVMRGSDDSIGMYTYKLKYAHSHGRGLAFSISLSLVLSFSLSLCLAFSLSLSLSLIFSLSHTLSISYARALALTLSFVSFLSLFLSLSSVLSLSFSLIFFFCLSRVLSLAFSCLLPVVHALALA